MACVVMIILSNLIDKRQTDVAMMKDLHSLAILISFGNLKMPWTSLRWLRVKLFIIKLLCFLRIQIQQEQILTMQRPWLEVERMERSIRDVMVMKMVNMVKMVAKGKKAATMIQQVKKMRMQAGGLEVSIFFRSVFFGDVLFDMMIFTIFIVTWNDFKSIWL